MGAKIDQKPKCFVECVPKRFQDAPRCAKTSQDAPRTAQDCPEVVPRRPQDAPRHPKTAPRWSLEARGSAQDRPEVVPGRLQDAARRPKTAPRWSQEAPETAQDAHRSERKKGPKAIRSTIPSRPSFWSVFGWIRDGFGDDFGSLGVDF